MADTRTRGRRLMLISPRPHTDTVRLLRMDTLHLNTDTLSRREWAITTTITSGTIVTGGSKTTIRGCSNITRTGLRRKGTATISITTSVDRRLVRLACARRALYAARAG